MTSYSSSAFAPPAPVARKWEENPMQKLTIKLLDTYRRINESYYEAKRLQQQPSRDDADSNLVIRPGEEIMARYRLEKRIGKGSFGQVVLAVDLTLNQEVAIKIIKSKSLFTQQAQEEIRILHRIDEHGDARHVIRLLDSFMFQNHQCLVFERLSMNLYDLIKNTAHQGVSFELVRKFAKQILVALDYLREEQIIHCDLKPENIMLCKPKRSMLRVIDFGSSCELARKPYTYIQSRYYRAPEIILGVSDYTCAIDMWSLGCILVEMHTGLPLFPGENEREQMHLIVGALGKPPAEMITSGRNTHKFFTPNWELIPLEEDFKRQGRLRTVEQALGIPSAVSHTGGSGGGSGGGKVFGPPPFVRWQQKPDLFEGLGKYLEFADFVGKMLTYAPSQRITPAEAMQHAFLDPPPIYQQQQQQQQQQQRSAAASVPQSASVSSSPQSTGSASMQDSKVSPKRPSKRAYPLDPPHPPPPPPPPSYQ